MSSVDFDGEMERVTSRIRMIRNMLKNKKYVLFSEGDPDFPEGLVLEYPEEWVLVLQDALEKLENNRKTRFLDKYGLAVK